MGYDFGQFFDVPLLQPEMRVTEAARRRGELASTDW